MRLSITNSLLLGLAHLSRAQDGDVSLGTAVARYPELSQFGSLISSNPSILTQIVPATLLSSGITVFAPTNAAMDAFAQQNQGSLATLSMDKLLPILQYHVLAARLTSSNFTTARKGITIPTLLREELYNNRSAGPQLVQTFGEEAAKGNVLFVSPDPISAAKLRVRQATTAHARGGRGQTSSVSAVDALFNNGVVQIIDTVLQTPSQCSQTIRTLKGSLTALDNALNRSMLYPTLDSSPNVTCLAPNDDAFAAAGNPDASLNETALGQALLFHTLPLVTYSNFLENDMNITSVAGLDVVVRMVDGDVYFNDAKVISPNVLTNNGLIHVLDRVMSPGGTPPSGGSTTTTGGSPTSTPTPTQTPNAGARPECGSLVALGAVVGAMVLAI